MAVSSSADTTSSIIDQEQEERLSYDADIGRTRVLSVRQQQLISEFRGDPHSEIPILTDLLGGKDQTFFAFSKQTLLWLP